MLHLFVYSSHWKKKNIKRWGKKDIINQPLYTLLYLFSLSNPKQAFLYIIYYTALFILLPLLILLLEILIFFPLSRLEGNTKECSNYCTIALISHTGKVMLKILQTMLQQYGSQELPDIQAGFRKGRATRDQIANIRWIIKKQESSRKISTSALLTMAKPLTVWITTNWKILQEMGLPDHLTCLPEKSVCRSRSNNQNWTWNNRLVPNWDRSTSRQIGSAMITQLPCTGHMTDHALIT